MAFKFYDSPGPEPGAVVWCKFPLREAKLAPGPVARPVLVLGKVRLIYEPSQTEFDDLCIQYGTGTFDDEEIPGNLHIARQEFKPLGLHKPTLFKMDLGNRRRLPWCEEYFVSQEYVRDQNIVAGILNSGQMLRMRSCLAQRGYQFPVPM